MRLPPEAFPRERSTDWGGVSHRGCWLDWACDRATAGLRRSAARRGRRWARHGVGDGPHTTAGHQDAAPRP